MWHAADVGWPVAARSDPRRRGRGTITCDLCARESEGGQKEASKRVWV